MRSVRLACALAITAAACGGKARPPGEVEDDDGPFVNRPDYKPTAFAVDVSGEGRPIIFIPGMACPGEVFEGVVERLGDGYESHVLTLAGFAGMPPIKPPLAAKVRRELVRYIRSRKLDAPIVVGHSLGGFIAYWLAASSPNLLGGVVVIDAGPALAGGDDNDARLLRNAWAQAGDDELPVRVRAAFSSMTKDPARVEPYLAAIAKSDRQTIGDTVYELVTTDILDILDRIRAPVLLVLADGGYRERYRQMIEDIENRETIVLRGTRHFVWFDDPDGFHAALAGFLERTAN